MAGIKGMKWITREKLEMEIAQDIQTLSKMAGPKGTAIADRIFENLAKIHNGNPSEATTNANDHRNDN